MMNVKKENLNKWIVLWKFEDISKKYFILNDNNNIGYIPNFGKIEYELKEDTKFSLQIDKKIFKTIEFFKPKIVSVSFIEKKLELNNCEGYTTISELENNHAIAVTAHPMQHHLQSHPHLPILIL